jgi:hypothetical protein
MLPLGFRMRPDEEGRMQSANDRMRVPSIRRRLRLGVKRRMDDFKKIQLFLALTLDTTF